MCAVGSNTQYGMAQEFTTDGTAEMEETTVLKNLLNVYQNTVYHYSLYLVMLPILITNRYFVYMDLSNTNEDGSAN